MVTLEEIVAAGGRTVATGAERFTHVVVDSRKVHAGDLFVALRGEHTDGHRFVHDAFAHGAAGALVREVPPSVPGGRTVVQATDPARTLWAMAERRRSRATLRMVGITGSVGKTTTKEWTYELLATRYRTFRTQGNLNSEIGLPMSLLELTGKEEAGVCELGMRGLGEIRALAGLARPQIGIITNIGVSHIGRLGSQDAIAKAKAELFEALPPDGVAICPGDEPYLPFLTTWAICSTWTVGQSADDTVRAEDLTADGAGMHFVLAHAGERVPTSLSLRGRHFLTNALLAAAAARACDVPLRTVAEALPSLRAQPGRSRVVQAGGITVVDDAYNASPSSLRAALEVLAATPGRRHVAIVGEMRELGPRSRQYHLDSGRDIARAGVNLLVAVGASDADALAEGARLEGLAQDAVLRVADTAEALRHLPTWVREGDAVLVKGAHALEMERLVQALVGNPEADPVCAPDARDTRPAEGTGGA